MKMNRNQIIIAVVVVVIICLAWMYMNRGGSGDSAADAIETTMPMSGYSLENDGYTRQGLPEALPETLPAVEGASIEEPDMMTMPTTVAPTTAAPSWGAPMNVTNSPIIEDAPEEFVQYAPRRFKGDIL